MRRVANVQVTLPGADADGSEGQGSGGAIRSASKRGGRRFSPYAGKVPPPQVPPPQVPPPQPTVGLSGPMTSLAVAPISSRTRQRRGFKSTDEQAVDDLHSLLASGPQSKRNRPAIGDAPAPVAATQSASDRLHLGMSVASTASTRGPTSAPSRFKKGKPALQPTEEERAAIRKAKRELRAEAAARLEEQGEELRAAVQEGNVLEVRRMIALDYPLNRGNMDGLTPLHKAAMYPSAGCKDVLEMLLDSGASINQRDDNGRTVLMLAALNGNLEAIAVLTGAGASTRLRAGKRYQGWGAIEFAVANGHTECMRQLLRAEPRAPDDTTLLQLAKSRGHTDTVAALQAVYEAHVEGEMDRRLAAEWVAPSAGTAPAPRETQTPRPTARRAPRASSITRRGASHAALQPELAAELALW